MEAQTLRYYLKIFSFIFLVLIYLTYFIILKEINFKDNYFIINKNQNINSVIEKNIINKNFINSFIYKIILKILLNNNYSIHYGKFKISNDLNFYSLLRLINKPSTSFDKITIIEGASKYQLNILINENFKEYHDLEYDELIANTYFFSKGSNFNKFKDSLIISKKNLEKKYENHNLLKRFSFNEIIIIGSLIEKEALGNSDKKKIFSVIINRLNSNMKLQIDATVIYAITEGKYKLDRNITYKDLKIKHPHNTYYIYGLPPSPISYVGLKTIEIIFENYITDYLFYFYNNSENKHIFSKNYKEHLRKLNEYRSK